MPSFHGCPKRRNIRSVSKFSAFHILSKILRLHIGSRILHYELVTGESVNITVSAEIAEVIYDSRRMEYASNERSRYHTAFSLDSEDYEGTNLVSEKTPDDLMAELENREHLLDCLAHLPSIVQAEQIFTVDKSRVLKYLGHLTPEEMSRVDDAVRASLALNPFGSIQRLPPIIRSTTAYAPPEVVDGKPPIYPYTPIKSSFEDAGSVEDMMLYTELEAAVHAMIQRLEYSFTFNPSCSPSRSVSIRLLKPLKKPKRPHNDRHL